MTRAFLLLEDGTTWEAISVAAEGAAVGEVVFTTSMTGYQEALTDPSFHGQLLTFTAPMIGNYGVEADADESIHVQARAMLCHEARNYAPNGRGGLLDWLGGNGVVALAELDTRALVRHLRDRGAMLGVAVGDGSTPEAARELLSAEPPMAGRLLADLVSGDLPDRDAEPERCLIVLVDYGAKDSIARLLAEAGAHVEVVPHDATAEDILAHDPDGILLANGPGDPGVDGRPRGAGPGAGRGQPAAVRDLPRPPAARPGARARDVQAPLRPPRREPPGARAGDRPRPRDDPEPRLRDPHARERHRRRDDHPRVALRPHGRGPAAARPARSTGVQYHPEAAPGPHDARRHLQEFVDQCAAARREALALAREAR